LERRSEEEIGGRRMNDKDTLVLSGREAVLARILTSEKRKHEKDVSNKTAPKLFIWDYFCVHSLNIFNLASHG
jgi:hypothetical protein